MGKRRINSWKQCTDVNLVEQFAADHGAEMRNAAGSHVVIRNPQTGDSFETVHHGHTQHDGPAHDAFKHFRAWGWLIVLLIPAACLFVQFAPALKAAVP